MNTKGKYPRWGQFLKSSRERSFRSAREFCSQVRVGISYPQYSRYESGDQLPMLEHALSIALPLGIPPLEMVLEWTLAQVPIVDISTRSGLEGLFGGARSSGDASSPAVLPSAVKTTDVPLDDVIVFNRSHLKLFSEDPAYRDVFTYINSFGPEPVGPEEIALALGLGLPTVQQMLEKLSDLGVVVAAGTGFRASKRNFYFPDDGDFFGLRNANLQHNQSRIMGSLRHEDLLARRAYRGVITRELTEPQVSLLLDGVERLMGSVVALPETGKPRTIYSLCVLFGKRFSRAHSMPADLSSGELI